MCKGLFITATGTDVGKTYVTALIIKKLREAGYNAGYYKAALSGEKGIKDKLYTGDSHYVKTIANLECSYTDMVSYVYETPVSPHLAAKIEGNSVKMEKVIDDYKRQCLKYDYITVEGSGGIICPIRYDDEKHIFLEDIIKELNLDVIIIADSGLGTINSTVLTARYLESINIQVKGIIFNRYHGGIMEDDNIKIIEEITNIPVIALVKDDDTNIDIDINVLKSLYKKDDN